MSFETICPNCGTGIISDCGCQHCNMSAEELGLIPSPSKDYFVTFSFFLRGSKFPSFANTYMTGGINTREDVQLLHERIFEYAKSIAATEIDGIIILAWMEVNK